jgi:tetratricopeptide (TPR) repeat protein
VLRDLGKPKEALTELERVEVDAPALVSVHSTLGRIYLDLGRNREARAELRKVLDAGKATADDKLGYAEATIDLGLTADGERALKDAIDAGALAGKTARLKLDLQSWKGPKEALAAARVLEKQRKGAAAHDASLALAAADAWRRSGDLKRASDDLRAALFGDALHANLGLGRVQLLQNDPVSAEASYRAALDAWQRGPYGVDDQTEARVGLARALLARKSVGDALATLTPCITDDPTAPEPHLWLARAYLAEGKRDQALAQAVRATELDDQYAEAFLLVGELSRSGHRDQAKKAFRRYLELAPSGSEARSIKRTLASWR